MKSRLERIGAFVAILALLFAAPERASAAPGLQFSSYLGTMSTDSVAGVAIDHDGNVYVVGTTTAPDLQVAHAAQPSLAGGTDLFVMKLSPDSRTVLYATYLGGSLDEEAKGIAVDAAGAVYVTGTTESLNFPVTPDAFDPDNGRFPVCQGTDCIDGFVTKIAPGGDALVYSTYLGGEHDDYPEAIAVDADGQACITGLTESFGYPQVHAFNGHKQGGSQAFVTKMAADGKTAVFSSYVGGNKGESGYGVAAAPDGGVVIVGSTYSVDFNVKNAFQPNNAGGPDPVGNLDAFVLKVNAAGELVFGTYLGGTGRDIARAVAVGADGTMYVAGASSSSDFPTIAPSQAALAGGTDAFLAVVAPNGETLERSTYLGGASDDDAYGVAAGAGGVAVAGLTESADFPVASAVQTACGGCAAPGYFSDAFLTVFDPGVVESTFLGGSGVDAARAVAAVGGGFVVAGSTFSSNFPTTAGVVGHDCPCVAGSSANGFVARIGEDAVEPSMPAIESVTGLKRPFRLDVRGSGFVPGAAVYIGTDTTPWPTAVVEATHVSIGGGKALKARFPKGVAVGVRVVNPDGGSATGAFAR